MNALVANSRNPNNTCEVTDLATALSDSNKPLVIDVRGPDIYKKQHVTGAVNIPVDQIAARRTELPQDLATPIVTVCMRGNASISGMLVLQSLGFTNVKSLNRGTMGWAEDGQPTAGN